MSVRVHAAAWLVWLAGCSPPVATQTWVNVRAEEGVLPSGTGELTVEIRVDGATTDARGPFVVSAAPNLLARFPVVPAEGDASRRFEVVATLARGDGLPDRVARAGGGYVEGEASQLQVWFYEVCEDVPDCGEGRTCTPDGCVGACSTLVPLDESEPANAPPCGRCQRCDANACVPLPDDTRCRCGQDLNGCRDGACVGCEGDAEVTETLVFVHVEPAASPTADRLRISVLENDAIRWIEERALDRSEEVTERVQVLAGSTESFDLLAELLEGETVRAEQRVGGVFTPGETAIIDVRMRPSCDGRVGQSGCGQGRTCFGGTCVASCFDGATEPSGGETRPRCGECFACVEGACRPVGDGDACGCAGDRCFDGECQTARPVGAFDLSRGHACAEAARDLYCWGADQAARLVEDSDVPIPVTLPAGADADEINAIALTDSQSCVVAIGGLARQRICWGFNAADRLALEAGLPARVLVPTLAAGDAVELRSVDGGIESFCGLSLSEGRILCFGRRFGDTTVESVLTPLTAGPYPDVGWSRLSAGWTHACAIQGGPTDGRVLCWGANSERQLGDGTDSLSPRLVQDPNTGAPLTGFIDIAVAQNRSCGVRIPEDGDAGEIWCWGIELSDRTQREPTPPMRVDQTADWRRIALGNSGTLCALDVEGRLWCRGDNAMGQLGLGDRSYRSEFESVGRTQDQRFLDVRVVDGTTFATDTTGALFSFGSDLARVETGTQPGLLGQGPLATEAVPRPIQVCFP